MATQTKAQLKFLKIAPRKVRLLGNLIKGLPVKAAEVQLLKATQRSAPALLKLLRSAVANAKNGKMDVEKLCVANIKVDKGPMLKRMLPRARGRATVLQKKMSHVSLVLEEKEGISQPQFNVIVPKKEKKHHHKKEKKAVDKKHDEKKPTEEKNSPVGGEKQSGFMKKIFRRKSV